MSRRGPVALSPLQQRIIDLSFEIVSTDGLEEFNRIASELKSALREHAEGLKIMVRETKKRLAEKSVDPRCGNETEEI